MGQKVNPTSMRLQLNKDWRSRWFAEKKDYKRFLIEDITVRKLIDDKYGFRGSINRVDIERAPNLVTVTVHTAKAGVVIGRGGSGAQELKAAVEKIIKVPVRLNIEEVKKPEMFAKLVAENIAHQLQRRISFRRAMKMSAQNTMRAGAKGIRVELAGRLNNSEMARREKEILGSVPLHTLRAEIDYALAVANTPAGTIGVKVWIHKGEAK
ncbi:30S ribosomal protein S3 [Candidatus Saccharibacteria bacterium]|jgi:small subunit ribosomal protein S3|nr:30S ribosomal protein S3 [Candidatus Saccharibacteria bacterium]